MKAWQLFKFQKTISYGVQQITCVCSGFCVLGGEVQWKNSKRSCDIVGNTKGQASKSQKKKHNLLTFLHPNTHRCPKDHMPEIKYSERPPLSLTNLVQIVVWSVRHQEIQLTKVQVFLQMQYLRGNMAWYPNQNFFWIKNNVLSSMYTWSKNKFPYDLFPKWLYTLVKKAQNCKKVVLKKMHCIFTYECLLRPKRSHEKKW